MDFDVFLTSNSTQVFSKVKAVNISDKRAVIPLSMEGRELLFADGGRRMTLCVMCGSLRCVCVSVCLVDTCIHAALFVQDIFPCNPQQCLMVTFAYVFVRNNSFSHHFEIIIFL